MTGAAGDTSPAAAPLSPVEFYPAADHQLDTAAQIARDKFLAAELGLTG
jgi:hypothetical protein